MNDNIIKCFNLLYGGWVQWEINKRKYQDLAKRSGQASVEEVHNIITRCLYTLQKDHQSNWHSSLCISCIFSFCVIRTSKMYSQPLSNTQYSVISCAHQSVSHTPRLLYSVTGSLWVLTLFTHFAHSPPSTLWDTNLFSVLLSVFFFTLYFQMSH